MWLGKGTAKPLWGMKAMKKARRRMRRSNSVLIITSNQVQF